MGVGSRCKNLEKDIKLDDYVGNKIANCTLLIKDNKTLLFITVIGSVYYFLKTNLYI